MIIQSLQDYIAQSGCGSIEITMKGSEIESIATSGDNSFAVDVVYAQPHIQKQLNEIDYNKVIDYISSYDSDLVKTDRVANLKTCLWLLAWEAAERISEAPDEPTWDTVKFCVTYLGKKPIATKTIIDYFLPIMYTACEKHAKILYAIYIDGGAPERHHCDLEYAVNCNVSDINFWREKQNWWREKLNMKVDIKPINN